jgi:hypothetical protein
MPYPGLRPFRREETDLFFGREDCITTMVDRLAATRFLAVLGSSGTGKSSLVRTGLIDALELGAMAQARSAWRVVDFRPGATPLKNLARRLLETEGAETGRATSQSDVDLLRAYFARGPRSIVEWCNDGHLPENTNLLLLVDQFEELFRYRDYAGREEAQAFVRLLLESARSSRFPIYVALTMRSEYLGVCALIEDLAESISSGLFLIPRMTREQCRSAIVGPAEVCDLGIDDALVNRLLNDLAAFAPWGDRGDVDELEYLVHRADQLPLLQYCLNRMWVRARSLADGKRIVLGLPDYEAIGGFRGALDTHGNEILGTLGGGLEPATEAVFRALTEGTTVADAVRHPMRFSELVTVCGGDEQSVRTVVDAFRASGCNFLTPELEAAGTSPLDGEVVVDISHDSLIRQWAKLSQWLENEVRAARQWRRLRDRFEDEVPMSERELSNMLAWRDDQKPNAAWAKRYGGDFEAVNAFLDSTNWERRRLAPVILPAIATATFAASFGVLFLVNLGLAQLLRAFGADIEEGTWILVTVIGATASATAVSCSFGLRRFRGTALKRAVSAGAIIFLCELATGMGTLFVSSAAPVPWWFATLYGPSTLIVLSVVDPVFRRITPWLILLVLMVAPSALTLGLSEGARLPADDQSLLVILVLAWLAALGFVLRRGSYKRPDKRFRAQVALRHGGLGISSFVLALVCIFLILLAFLMAGVLSAAGKETNETNTVLGFALFLAWFIAVIGIALGIFGAIDSKSKKTFPLLGLILGLLILVSSVALVLIGMSTK